MIVKNDSCVYERVKKRKRKSERERERERERNKRGQSIHRFN
jgi:hypothetical protein